MRPIPNFLGKYKATEDGQIYSEYSQKFLKLTSSKNQSRYSRVGLVCGKGRRKTFAVHRLIALTFIENPENHPVVNHKDKNTRNNAVENLEWVTYSRNAKHSHETGRKVHTKPVQKLDLDGNLLQEFKSLKEAEKETGIDRRRICAVCRGRRLKTAGFRWRYTEDEKHPLVINRNRRCKKVRKLDPKTGELIKIFEDANEAAKDAGCFPQTIRGGCNGAIIHVRGFKWEYVTEKEPLKKDSLFEEVQAWKKVIGFEKYRVSNDGRIYSEKTKRFLRTRNSDGYRVVTLSKNSKITTHRIHSLVYFAYSENVTPGSHLVGNKGLVINHKDGDKSNNSFENLELISRSNNSYHAARTGLTKGAKKVAHLNKDDEETKVFYSIAEAARHFKICASEVSNVCNGKSKTTRGHRFKFIDI